MPLPLAVVLLWLSAIYLLAGLLLLPWLYLRAWPKAAPGAHGASRGFRIVVLPGTLLLWPWLVRNSRHPALEGGSDPRSLRRAQSILLVFAAVTVVFAVALSLATRRAPRTMDRLPPALLRTR